MKFLHDKHSYGTKKLYSEGLAQFQVSLSEQIIRFFGSLTILRICVCKVVSQVIFFSQCVCEMRTQLTSILSSIATFVLFVF